MNRFAIFLVMTFTGIQSAAAASAAAPPNDQVESPTNSQLAREGEPQIRFPSAATILRAARGGAARPQNEQIQCKLVKQTISDEKVYPIVGRARLFQTHFKCIVTTSDGSKVVYIDECRLIPVN